MVQSESFKSRQQAVGNFKEINVVHHFKSPEQYY